MKRLLLALMVCWLVISSAALGTVNPPEKTDNADQDLARSALKKGDYNWYDAPNDRVKGVDLRPEVESTWLKSLRDRLEGIITAIGDFFAWIAQSLHLPTIGGFDNALPIGLTCAGVVLLVILIRILWTSASFEKDEEGVSGRIVGGIGRVRMLPGEMAGSSVADPWSEAVERHRRGDYSGAIIYLFAHQLLELDRLGLIRLSPGGTGRKYVRSVDDARLHDPIQATLGLFEQAYYGHKQLSASSFEPIWAAAQLFQSQLALIEKHAP